MQPRKPVQVIREIVRERSSIDNPLPPQPPANAKRPVAKILDMAPANRAEALRRWHSGTRLVELRKSFGGRVPELEVVLMGESRRNMLTASERLAAMQHQLEELRRRYRKAA